MCIWWCGNSHSCQWSQSLERAVLYEVQKTARLEELYQLLWCKRWSVLVFHSPHLMVQRYSMGKINTETQVIQLTQIHDKIKRFLIKPARASPGPSAFTLEASCEGSTLTWNGLTGISWNTFNMKTPSLERFRNQITIILDLALKYE